MSRDLRTALTIDAKDRASGTVRRVSGDAARQAERVGSRTKKAAEDAARAQERAAGRSQNAYTREARAREQLGIRAETRIRREIVQTEAAYNRLARSGRLSAAEQSRAYTQMQNRVSALRREMGGLERDQTRVGRAGSVALRAGKFLMAGGAAGGTVLAVRQLAQPVGQTMDYESRLAMMANTAYAERDAAGRISGMRILKEAVNQALRQGGGNRDAAAETLDALLASGAMSQTSAMNLLPTLQKAATATGALPTDLAQVAISGMQTFGIQENQIPQMLDMAVKAGQAGGFELRDMASWLPKVMAMAKTSGMSGLEDFGTLAAALQASKITAGSADAGGNNLANLLAKINSRDTARQAEKLEISPGKSIDLAGTLKTAAGKGINSLDAFVGIVDQVVAKNKEFQSLQKQLADPALEQGDRAEVMRKQADILQGSAIGQLVQDQQALLALVGYMGNRQYVKDIIGTYGNGVNAIGTGFEVMASTGQFKVQQGKNQWQAGEYEAFKGLSEIVGDFSGKFADLAAEYPGMTAAAVLATDSLKALATIAGSAMLLAALRGRGAGPVMPRRGGGDALVNGAVVGGSGALRRGFGKVGAAGPLLAAGGALGAYQIMSDGALTSEQKADALLTQGSRTGGQIGGAYAGAAAGSFLFGPVGGVIGGIAGAVGGDYLGEALGQRVIDAFSGPPLSPEEARARMRGSMNLATGGLSPADLQAAIIAGRKEPQALDVKVTVDVQNGNIAAAVNEINERAGRRN